MGKYRIYDEDNNIFEYIDFNNLSYAISILDFFRDYFSDTYLTYDKKNLMRFTGLKDDIKKEIYEEDICHIRGGECYHGIYEYDKIGVIRRHGLHFDFVVDNVGQGLGWSLEYSSIVVIGNTKIKNNKEC